MEKVRCEHCKDDRYYNEDCKKSMSHHRVKYRCGLPRGVPSPPRLYHTDAERRSASRASTARWRENKRNDKKSKVRPVTSPVSV